MNGIDLIERLLLEEFETVPFHNLFMLNGTPMHGSQFGGTCSDKVLHFQAVLRNHGIEAQLHTARINGHLCHRMLLTEIQGKLFFIDVGSGWPTMQLIPASEPIRFSAYGIVFLTEVSGESVRFFQQTGAEFSIAFEIPLARRDEAEVLAEIDHRFENKSIYPFASSLRFSKVADGRFYFLKGNRLRIFAAGAIEEFVLSIPEIWAFLVNTMNFDLENLKEWVPADWERFVKY